jgi:hypothetical protein
MSLGNLDESTPGFYVGLSKDAEILRVYNSLADAINDGDTNTHIVSIGYLTTMVQDYEEIYSYDAGLAHDPDDCEACADEGEPA